MDSVMVASFMDEMSKIAVNFAAPAKPLVGGNGANTVAKPLPTPGFGPSSTMAKPAKTTNYSIVNSTAPAAAGEPGGEMKSLEPPPVRT